MHKMLKYKKSFYTLICAWNAKGWNKDRWNELRCPRKSSLNDRLLRNFLRFSIVSSLRAPLRIDEVKTLGSGYDQTVDKYRSGVPRRRRWTGSLAARIYPVIIRQLERKDTCTILEGVDDTMTSLAERRVSIVPTNSRWLSVVPCVIVDNTIFLYR